MKSNFFCARVESACCSSSTLCTSATFSTPSCTTLEATNTISEEPQIPPGGTDQLTQLEIEQELWFLNTLKEYYDKLDLTDFTPQMVQSELYKNFLGSYFSKRQIAHISSLNKYPKHSGINTFQPDGQEGTPGRNWSAPAEDTNCWASTPPGSQAGPEIPVPRDRYAGQRIRQTGQGLNTVQNLSPHKLRKIACWIETGQYGLISEIGGAFGLQEQVLYPTQKISYF